MLQKAKTIFSRIFILILALSFISWGANSGFENVKQSVAITVGNEEISVSEIQTEFEFRKKEAERQFGGQLTTDFLRTIQLGNITVNNMINAKIALNAADNLGFRPSGKAMREQILNTPSFKDADGKFSMDLYKRAVSNFGYSVSGYEKLMGEETQKQFLFSLFENNFNTPSYVEALYVHANQKANIRALLINSSAVAAAPMPSVAEIKAFYDANSDRYETDETRTFHVLVLNEEDFKGKVNVTEEEILAVYNENPASFDSEEMRKARHILVPSRAIALEVLTKLEAGEKFEDLVNTYSTDSFTVSNGGDLGYFASSEMVEAFSETAFKMEVGTVSEPVQTPFGYHVIELLDVKQSGRRTFEDVRAEILADLQREKSEDLYFATFDKVEDSFAAGKLLPEISKELNIKLSTHNNIKQNNFRMTYANDILPVAFELDEGAHSAPIEIAGSSGIIAFVEVAEITPSRTLTIEEATSEIVAELKEIATAKAIAEKGQALLLERQNTTSLETVARRHNLAGNLQSFEGISRQGLNAPAWLGGMYLNLLFAVNEGEALSSLINTPDGVAIVELVSVNSTKGSADELSLFREKLANDIAEDLFAQFMNKQRQNTAIKINTTSVKSALGAAYVE